MNNLPTMMKVALGLTGLALVLFLAGFGSSYWMTTPSFHYGLWVICTSVCRSYNEVLSSTPAHAYVTRFCCIYEMIASIVAIVLLCLFAFKSARPSWAKAGYITLLTAGILGFLGAVIFIAREKASGASSTVNVGWSGIVVIWSGILNIIAAVLIILPIRRGQVEFEQV